MSRSDFYDNAHDNFGLSGDAARLLDNILGFVKDNYQDENEQYVVLCDLLDGTVRLPDREIRETAF